MKTSRFLITIAVLALSLLLVTGSLAAASRSASSASPMQPQQDAGPLPEGQGPWVVRAYFDDPKMVTALAQRLEPWEVNKKEGYVVVQVDQTKYLWAQWLGFRLEVDERLTEQLTQPPAALPGQTNGIPGFPCYRTVEETYATAEQLVADYPDLATWIDIGDSWDKTSPGGNPGFDMRVLRLTNSNVPGIKPTFFAMSAIHAREYTTAELATRFAEHLLANYNVDPDITWLLDHHEIHLLLQTNPDGRKIAETGDLWRKNVDNDDGCTTPDWWGTDLNRNYNFQWACCGGSSGDPCDETYRGPSAGSEPETIAVQNYLYNNFPDQRDDDLLDPAPDDATGVFLDIHSYSQLVLWPWGFGSTAPNGTDLQTLGRKFAYFNNYDPAQQIWYDVDGATDDFAYGRLGVAAYVFEIGTDFFQDCATFESTILPDNMDALIYAAKVARTPYMTPAGPESLSVLAAPVAIAPGDPVLLTAIANDTRFNNGNGTEPTQNIAAAEYYIDTPYWSSDPTPIAYPMSASDGAFNEKVEDIQATVDTTGLSSGRHMIFVRAQDVDGNWGPVSAAFLYVVDPEVAPRLEGYVRDFATNAPLEASISADLFAASSDPATGYYSMMTISGTYDVSALAQGHIISTVNQVQLQDYEIFRQNFYLEPTCAILSDDVESGNLGWTAQTPWAITEESAHSPTHSWTESPGSNYSNSRNTSLTSPVFNLSGATGTSLSFWHTYETEPGYDYGRVEYSTNGGSTWIEATRFSGSQTTWELATIPLPALDGDTNARIRFRFTSDSSAVDDGWHIDDILLSYSGASCVTPLEPTAHFTSNSPVLPGDTVTFINMTQGSNPLSYEWDFGDGAGTSTESDPAYTYPISGTYLVTLTATNSEGSDSVTHPVVVQPCHPLEGVTLTLQTTGTILLGQPAVFQVDIAPDDATLPYEYEMDFGDGSLPQSGIGAIDPMELSYTYTLPGEFQAEVIANGCGITDTYTDTVPVTVTGGEGIALSPAEDSRVGQPGSIITYTLNLTNTGPVSNTFDLALSGNLWSTTITPTVLGPLAPGSAMQFTVEVGVPADADGGASDTATVTASSHYPGIIPATASLTTFAANLYGMEAAAEDTTLTGMPGTSVAYSLMLTNTGNTTDTFSVSASGIWTATVQGGPFELGRGEAATFEVSVAIPSVANYGASDAATVSIVSAGDPQVGEEIILTTTAGAHKVHLPLVMTE